MTDTIIRALRNVSASDLLGLALVLAAAVGACVI
jgi:hypothetical protein